METIIIGTFALGIIALLGTYWTVWKIRNDLIEGRNKLISELSEIRKLLESKGGSA